MVQSCSLHVRVQRSPVHPVPGSPQVVDRRPPATSRTQSPGKQPAAAHDALQKCWRPHVRQYALSQFEHHPNCSPSLTPQSAQSTTCERAPAKRSCSGTELFNLTLLCLADLEWKRPTRERGADPWAIHHRVRDPAPVLHGPEWIWQRHPASQSPKDNIEVHSMKGVNRWGDHLMYSALFPVAGCSAPRRAPSDRTVPCPLRSS